MKSWQVSFILKREEWVLVEALLSDVFSALSVRPVSDNDPQGDQHIALLFPDEPEQASVQTQLDYIFGTFAMDTPEIMIEALPDIDWLQHVYAQLKPVEAGRFFIHGSHVTTKVPEGKIPLLIEAATAFGTGEHPTTKGCLLAFDALLGGAWPHNILDMGCGSGILGIAAAKTLPDARILGVDIDPNSVTVAHNHARDNQVGARINFVAGDGFRTPEVAQYAPYDLVFGNILAQPLIDMAESLCGVATKDIILSGFTKEQAPYVEKAYVTRGYDAVQSINSGCDIIQQNVIDEWVTLWLRRK